MAFKFRTIEEAEDYYEKNINSNSNNCNEEWTSARDSWVDDNSHLIEECALDQEEFNDQNL